jgi:hypothetical protein
MKQAIYGVILFVFLLLPPVIDLAESIMSIHMHMQMPLIGVAGMLMTPLLQKKFPRFFRKWNGNGVPGIILFIIIILYWLIPRAMDDTLAYAIVEVFKFISWAFLVGVPLRDSWPKLTKAWKNGIFIFLSIIYLGMASLYIFSEDQLCNNYLIVEQRALGWGFLLIAFCLLLYFIQTLFIREEDFQE